MGICNFRSGFTFPTQQTTNLTLLKDFALVSVRSRWLDGYLNRLFKQKVIHGLGISANTDDLQNVLRERTSKHICAETYDLEDWLDRDDPYMHNDTTVAALSRRVPTLQTGVRIVYAPDVGIAENSFAVLVFRASPTVSYDMSLRPTLSLNYYRR